MLVAILPCCWPSWQRSFRDGRDQPDAGSPTIGPTTSAAGISADRTCLTYVIIKVTIVTNMITADDALSRALLGKTRGAILALLYGSPDQPLHVRRIARLAGCGLGPTHRELQLLARLGIIRRQTIGQHVLYSPDPACPVHAELRALIQKTVGVAAVLRRALVPVAGDIRVAFLFGSFARGQQRAASDIDVLVIGDAPFRTVAQALLETQRQLSREINPIVYGPAEFAGKWRQGHAFLSAVMAGPKTFLLGDEHELSRVVEEWLATTAFAHGGGSRRPARRGRATPSSLLS